MGRDEVLTILRAHYDELREECSGLHFTQCIE